MLGPPDLAMQRRRQPESHKARTTGTGWCCKPSLSSAEGWQGIGDRCLFHDCSSLFVPSLSFLGLETVPDYSGGLAVRKASDVPLALPIFASLGKICPPSRSRATYPTHGRRSMISALSFLPVQIHQTGPELTIGTGSAVCPSRSLQQMQQCMQMAAPVCSGAV